jgi:hypothetical protein
VDLSKLPKLSQTQQTPPESNVPPPAPVAPFPMAGPGIGADVWFNTVIGLLVLYLGKTFGAYLWARLTGQTFHTGIQWTSGDQAGQEVPYSQVQGYAMLSDASLFFFGMVILMEAMVKAWFGIAGRAPRVVVMFALALAVATLGLNLFVCFKVLTSGAVPIISGLAVAYAGYIVMDLRIILRGHRVV